ncbi:Pdz Domain-Containing Ring Finger Protein 4 [Manis pentadactyla]|nr:Pdz Domain-Containing Ring Finger Protein 4 [Manis pentadactyla]
MPEEQCPFHRPLIAPRSRGFGEAATPGGLRALLREARVRGRLERSGAGRSNPLSESEASLPRVSFGS